MVSDCMTSTDPLKCYADKSFHILCCLFIFFVLIASVPWTSSVDFVLTVSQVFRLSGHNSGRVFSMLIFNVRLIWQKFKTDMPKDVSLAEAGKYGSLNDFAFFDKVLLQHCVLWCLFLVRFHYLACSWMIHRYAWTCAMIFFVCIAFVVSWVCSFSCEHCCFDADCQMLARCLLK